MTAVGARHEVGAVGAVKRCAIYIRVSTAMQRMEGWSLDAQRASLEAFARAQGWKVIDVYADEGKSARKRLKGRKEIFRLLDDVRAGKIDVILFKELDRWFRSVSDFYRVQDILDDHGVTWVSERQPNLGMATKEDRLQVNLLLSVGQNETDSTSDRIKYTNKFLREQKRWTAGKVTLPRCYTVDENQRVLIDPEPERAPFVRAIIDYFFQTGSVRAALIQANAEFGQSFRYGNCINLLRNSMLCGEYMEVKDFVEKPLMTPEEFKRMQDMMKRNARGLTQHFYIFAGLVACPDCGRPMVGNHTQHRVKAGPKCYLSYRCNTANQNKACPNNRSLNEEKIEKHLLGAVQEAVADRIAHVEKVIQDHKKRPKKKSNRAQIEAKLKRLKNLYIDDDITWEEYQKKKAKILEDLIEEDPEPEVPEIADLEKIQAVLSSGVLDLYKDFTPEEKREFWRGILRRVVVKDGQVVDVDFIE
ncbi:MAG: recombinase family protein [Rikenellaceae bacterium]|nr:recombinase family protein [Rikenellaceae bacterium]